MRLRYKIMLAVITVGIGVCLMAYQSYALWVATYTSGENIVSVGCFDIEFTEQTSSIGLNNTYPVSDAKGLSSTPYTFTITNKCTVDASYDVTLNTLTTNTMEKGWLKYALQKSSEAKPSTGTNLGTIDNYNTATEELQIPNLDESIIIESGTLKGRSSAETDDGESVTYNLYLWMDETTGNEEMNTRFEGSVNIITSATKTNGYKESILNGTDPVLKEPLIAVTIENDGTVKRADLTSEWYSYENKEWANAIILTDESTSTNYQPGDVIPEEAIESYFVWIPRYRYQIFDDGNYTGLTSTENAVQTIQIVFENKDTPVSSGTSVGSWLTHPAFTVFNSNGMWVGKFEPSRNGGDSDNIRNGDAIQIKPNVSSWRSIQVANAFYTSYDYKRDLDSHMMKNTEWGAVAYLQHSVYGSSTSVRINNNSDYITGYAANNEPTCGYTATNEECNRYCNDGTCNTAYPNSVLASTTGNITGIYDMSGGSWEFVMGVMVDQSGKPMSGRNSLSNSGFNGTFGCPTCDSDSSGLTSLTGGYDWPAPKYYDTYSYGTTTLQYQRRILGDATGEMGPFNRIMYLTQTKQVGSWYTDVAHFVNSNEPWFKRGGAHTDGLDTGMFDFYVEYGRATAHRSFRVVLTP